MLDDLVGNHARRNLARPAPSHRNATCALPVGVLLASEGVMALSGHVFICGPLSVLYITKVLSPMPSSSSRLSNSPTFLSWSIIVSWYGDCQRPACPRLSGLVCVRRCMWVVLTQQKNGVPAACWRLIQSLAAATNSSSQVSIRFFVSGPVSSILCLPTLPNRVSVVGSSLSVAQQCSTPRGPKRLRNSGKSLAGG